MELEVRSGEAMTRHPMKPVNGVYRADVVLLPERKGTERVTLKAAFTDGSLVGSTADRAVKVGAVAHKLSELRALSPAQGQAVLRSGVPLEGKVTGVEAVPVALGGKEMSADLSTAQEVTLQVLGDEPVLVLEVVARRGGSELGRVSRAVLLDEANKVYLAELTPFATKPGPWPLQVGVIGEPPTKQAIAVNGKEYPKGLGLHANAPPATATYRLSRATSVFRTMVALADTNGGEVCGPTHFEVYGDGKLLWKSKAITTYRQTDDCLIHFTGVDVLELRVGHQQGNGHGAHAVWLEPILVGPDPVAIRRAAGKN